MKDLKPATNPVAGFLLSLPNFYRTIFRCIVQVIFVECAISTNNYTI
jgi:hypothetical protein